MTEISAADNLTIQIDADQWRLLSYAENGTETELLRVAPQQALAFHPDFALTRRFPTDGTLTLEYINKVILGWSEEDSAWHLGLLLSDEFAQLRGSRWCEIAHWPEPEPSVFQALAEQSGRELARIMDVDFQIVPPRASAPVESADELAPVTPEPKPEVPLTEPPFHFGMWDFQRNADGTLQFTRTRRWRNGRIVRILFYGLMTVIYVVLSIATLQSDLALPNSGILLPSPEYLPYLGLFSAWVTLIITIMTLYELLFKVNVIRIEPDRIAGLRGDSGQWEIPLEDLEAIYITHLLSPQRKHVFVKYGEINAYTKTGTFIKLMEQSEDETEQKRGLLDNRVEKSVTQLHPEENLTDLQTAALHICKTLQGDIACYYDQRRK
jgi:hypothetical protein